MEHFRWRVLQDALLEATAIYWRRRAVAFAAVGTHEGDQIALACRNKALFLELTGLDQEAIELIAAALAGQDRRPA